MKLTVSTFLLGLSLVSCATSVSAAAINFDSLDIQQGFNFQGDVQTPCGFLTGLTLNGQTFIPDFSVKVPTNPFTTISVVGVLSSIEWNGGLADSIVLHAMVSTSTKQTIALDEHTTLSTPNVSFNFQVYDYDPVAKSYFETFYPSQNQALSGKIEKQGVNYLFNVSTSPDSIVVNPINYEFSITIQPAQLTQFLVFATDSTHSTVHQFGVGIPDAPTISGVGTANLAYHSANLQATVNPGNAATGANFHYGSSPSLSSYLATPVNALGSGGSGVAFSSPISNLTAGATYYYQVIATNSAGNASSSIASFNTVPLPSPRINTVTRQGNDLILVGTSGATNTVFYVISTTNLSSPRSTWVVLATNQFNAAGNFTCVLTNAVTPASRAVFYQLQTPSN